MSQTLAPSVEFSTVADLLHHLGDVPAERIRMKPLPGTATIADAVRNNEQKLRPLVELVDGVLVEKVMGYHESRLAMRIGQHLLNFLDEHDLGVVAGEAGMMELCPNLLRIPDVSFVSWDQFPDRKLPTGPCPEIAPDLAVEVISRSNTKAEMERKRREYFEAGARLVWYVYPETQTVAVYTADAPETPTTETESVNGGEVLPGFRLSLSELFAKAGGGS